MTEYFIIYPSGDRNRLSVLEYDTNRYDLDEYALASRNTFPSGGEANAYGKILAFNNSLLFEPFKTEKHDYLD